jgi:hypothetical protein
MLCSNIAAQILLNGPLAAKQCRQGYRTSKAYSLQNSIYPRRSGTGTWVARRLDDPSNRLAL